jgi:hypothetical protein
MEENTFPVESKMKGWSGWEGEDSLGKERELLFGDGLSVGYHWSHFLISVHIQTISPDFLDLIKSRLAHNRKVASTIKVCLSEALLKMEEGGGGGGFPILCSRRRLRSDMAIMRDVPSAASSLSSIIAGGTSATFQRRCVGGLFLLFLCRQHLPRKR